jgi:hypothetical protein
MQGDRRSEHAKGKDAYQALFLQQQVRQLVDESAPANAEKIQKVRACFSGLQARLKGPALRHPAIE